MLAKLLIPKKKKVKFSVVIFRNVEKYNLQEPALWANIPTMSLLIYSI